MPAVVVFVGAAASGKTTLRHRMVDAGLDPALVVNLDRMRADARMASGRWARPLMRFSGVAVRAATRRQRALMDGGHGYVADATHLRRAERRGHVRAAHGAGLRAVCLLMPAVPVDVLSARNAERPPDQRVPDEALHRHAHRRALLDVPGLRDEGFDSVYECAEPARTEITVTGGARTSPVGGEPHSLSTPSGPVVARLHEAPGPLAGAVLLGGADEETGGPGPALAEELRCRGVTCLRLTRQGQARHEHGVEAAFAAVRWLTEHRGERVLVLGWSAGASVAEEIGTASDAVLGTVTPRTVGLAARHPDEDRAVTAPDASWRCALLATALSLLTRESGSADSR